MENNRRVRQTRRAQVDRLEDGMSMFQNRLQGVTDSIVSDLSSTQEELSHLKLDSAKVLKQQRQLKNQITELATQLTTALALLSPPTTTSIKKEPSSDDGGATAASASKRGRFAQSTVLAP